MVRGASIFIDLARLLDVSHDLTVCCVQCARPECALQCLVTQPDCIHLAPCKLYVCRRAAAGAQWNAPVVAYGKSGQDVGRYSHLLVMAGLPVLFFQDATNTNLLFLRALNAQVCAWALPHPPMLAIDAHSRKSHACC